jgi:hypothetical protein
MAWERTLHLIGPVALLLIVVRPLVRRRGHYLIDRRAAWLCLFAGIVWPLSVALRRAAGAPADDRLTSVLDTLSVFFGGVLFAYGYWALRRVRFSLHSDGDEWAERYRRSEKKVRTRSRLFEGK